jgi:DNA-binding NarL/FixJ family response regulator
VISENAADVNHRPIAHGTTHPGFPEVLSAPDEALSAGRSAPAAGRVLIVEDDFLIASDVESALRDAGIEISGVASSAEEALELAETHRPTLAIMDIRLAGQRDGVEAALDLFRLYGIRCVFATAHHDAFTLQRAQPANPLAWVPKPYSVGSLVEIVRAALMDILRADT